MEITTEPLESCQLRLTIEVDEERTHQAMRHAARQIAKQANIPGFRKGKAPYELIVQRYGEDTVRKEAAEALVETIFREAIEQEKIKSYAPGKLEEIELHPVTFKFTVSLPPTTDPGDYRDYRLKPPKVRVHKKEIRQALEEIRKQNAILEPVERQTFHERRPLAKRILKINIAAHRFFGHPRDLFVHAGQPCHLVDDLHVYQRAIHVKKHDAFALSIRFHLLQREIDIQLVTSLHHPFLEP